LDNLAGDNGETGAMLDEMTYLTVDEAAQRLGVSTIRLRLWIREKRVEALLDNQGRWRVRLNVDPNTVAPVPLTGPTDAIDVLIDEIMELRLAVADTKRTAERLEILAARQQQVLDRALARAEAERAGRIAAERRATALADQVGRSLDLAEAAMARAADKRERAG